MSQGVHAVFAVTNWWEHLFRGKTQEEAGEVEERQGMNIARAAAKTAGLEHYIWSTCPSARKQFEGKHMTPHSKNSYPTREILSKRMLTLHAVDYKAKIDDRIKAELPELAAKTTYLYFGYYPSNLVVFPFLIPCQLVCVTLLRKPSDMEGRLNHSPRPMRDRTSKSSPPNPTPKYSFQAT